MKRINLLAFCVAALTLLFGIQTHRVWSDGETLFHDDFERETLTNWAPTPGWSIVQHEGNRRLKGEGTHHHLNPRTGHDWANYTLGVGVQLVKGAMNIMALVNRVGVRYFVELSEDRIAICRTTKGDSVDPNISTTPSDGVWAEVEGGTQHIFNLAVSNKGLTPGQWHFVEIAAVGGQIQVSVDKELRLEYSDPKPLTAGTIGFEIYGRTDAEKGTAYFDEVTVTSSAAK